MGWFQLFGIGLGRAGSPTWQPGRVGISLNFFHTAVVGLRMKNNVVQ